MGLSIVVFSFAGEIKKSSACLVLVFTFFSLFSLKKSDMWFGHLWW